MHCTNLMTTRICIVVATALLLLIGSRANADIIIQPPSWTLHSQPPASPKKKRSERPVGLDTWAHTNQPPNDSIGIDVPVPVKTDPLGIEGAIDEIIRGEVDVPTSSGMLFGQPDIDVRPAAIVAPEIGMSLPATGNDIVPVPAPGAIGLLMLAGLGRRRRRA